MDKHTEEYSKTLDKFEEFLCEYLSKEKNEDNGSFNQIASAFNKEHKNKIRTRPMLNELERKFVVYKEDNGKYGFIKRYHTSHYKEGIKQEEKEKDEEKLFNKSVKRTILTGSLTTVLGVILGLLIKTHKQEDTKLTLPESPLKIELVNDSSKLDNCNLNQKPISTCDTSGHGKPTR